MDGWRPRREPPAKPSTIYSYGPIGRPGLTCDGCGEALAIGEVATPFAVDIWWHAACIDADGPLLAEGFAEVAEGPPADTF